MLALGRNSRRDGAKPRSMANESKPWLVIGVCAALGLTASTTRASEAWHRGDPVLVPDAGPLVPHPKSKGMPVSSEPSNFELGLSAGQTWLGCPSSSSNCEGQLGWSGNIALFHRPLPWFSWGASLESQTLGQQWRESDVEWQLAQRLLSGRLLARVHATSQTAFDPYVAVSLGGAALETHARASSGEHTSPEWIGSPLYGVRVGFNFRVSSSVGFGAFADWTSMQVNSGETCPWLVGGVCSSQNWSAFPPAGAIWNVAATVSFAFGDEL